MEAGHEWCPLEIHPGTGALLNLIFINEGESGIECTVSKFTVDAGKHN